MTKLPLDRLHGHPANPNRMPRALFEKLVAHIRASGQYPPLIVRPHQERDGHYQIIDGHHRAEALRSLDHTEANCDVWKVDDAQTTMLLLTLNRLHGEDDPAARGRLLQELTEHTDIESLAKLLPDDEQRICKLIALNEPAPPPAEAVTPDDLPQAVTFFLSAAQRRALFKRLDAVDRDRSAALVQLLELD